jgi:Tfp pilus assembly protein PilF
MKKTVSLLVAALMAVFFVSAQSVADGVKYITFGKEKSALDVLRKAYNSNSKDASTIYWYGQALLAQEPTDVKGAKEVYQKALQEAGLNPQDQAWIIVGMGQIDLIEGADLNTAKQKFEQAITNTIEQKGKNKGKPNADILNAIGRANAFGSSKIGDPTYAIDKLKQAGAINLTNADIYVNMGILYQKIGGDMGGEAVKAYTEATTRDPKSADAFWHIGMIYSSQNNRDLMEQYFAKAVAADPTYPPTYLEWFKYYQNRDVSLAKEYLDKYIQYADKDCKTEYYYADYLFRAGKYQESLDKAKAMDAGECKTYSKLPILYAFNYDRLGDSIQAKSYLDKFLAVAPIDKMEPAWVELIVKVYSKFQGNEAMVAGYLQKTIDNDTSRDNKLKYYRQGADMFAKASMFNEQVQWLQKYNELKGSMGEYDYYTLSNAAINAKNYVLAIDVSKKYLIAFPAKPQPISFLRRAAIASDPDSTTGSAIEPLTFLNTELYKDSVKYKKDIFKNLYYMINYYVDKAKDLPKALEVANKMLWLFPEAGEENTFAANSKKAIEAGINRMNQPARPATRPATQGSGGTTKPATSSGSGSHK